MSENDWLAAQFEANRTHLRGVAYRMLGSLNEADDAVQESWLRFSRADTRAVENLGGWLTTVVARVSLDMLRSRRARRDEPAGDRLPEPSDAQAQAIDPEQEAILADSVGLALLVVLERLAPAERLAFVLHDLFDVPFDEIASLVGRSPSAARQLASRARRRVRGVEPTVSTEDVARQREVVDAFLAAARGGDFEGLLAVLDPNIAVRANGVMPKREGPLNGAAAVAQRAIATGALAARAALVNGAVGLVIAPRGRLMMVLDFTIANGKVVGMNMITGSERLRELDLKLLE